MRSPSPTRGVGDANGANDLAGPGAVLVFSDVVEGDRLEPGESSDAKPLLFRRSDLRPLRDGNDFKLGLLELEARILGLRTPG